jgi:elongation factor P
MADTLDYNEIKERRIIVLYGEPHEVLSSHIARKQQGKPTNQVKLRNLTTGVTRQEVFRMTDTAEEADVTKRKSIFMFKKENRQTNTTEYWFHDEKDRSNRFMISGAVIEEKAKFLKEGTPVDAVFFNEDRVISVNLPVKMDLKVVDAPAAVKGDTARGGGTKAAIVETGASIQVPLFIAEGDVIRVNTETGEYVERA